MGGEIKDSALLDVLSVRAVNVLEEEGERFHLGARVEWGSRPSDVGGGYLRVCVCVSSSSRRMAVAAQTRCSRQQRRHRRVAAEWHT